MVVIGVCAANAAAKWGYRENQQRLILTAERDLARLQAQQAQPATQPVDAALAQKRIAAQESGLAALRSDQDAFRWFSRWDAARYEEIVNSGYIYHHRDDPREVVIDGHINGRMENIVWYPLYPVLGVLVQKASGLATAVALNVVSIACLIVAVPIFFLMARRHYFVRRGVLTPNAIFTADISSANQGALFATALLLFGPCGYFLYGNFTESLFILLLASFLYCLQGRNWWAAALTAAVASACRSQGVLFGPILALSFLLRAGGTFPRRLAVAVVLGMISAVGLLTYMGYLKANWGDPMAFMHAQKTWNVGLNASTLAFAANPLHAIENFLGTLHKPAFWPMAWPGKWRPDDWPMDWPLLWQAASVLWPPVLLLLGRRWLSFEQTILGWILWGLPYVSNSMAGYPPQSMEWMSMSRYISAALPLQLILGAAAMRHRWLGPVLLAASAAAFGVFAFKGGGDWWLG